MISFQSSAGWQTQTDPPKPVPQPEQPYRVCDRCRSDTDQAGVVVAWRASREWLCTACAVARWNAGVGA